MQILRFLLMISLMLCSIVLHAQAGGKYAPFSVDSDTLTATLRVKGTSLIKRYTAVFQKHHLDASSAVDWNSVIEEIAGMEATDLYSSGDLSFNADEEGTEISATSVEALMKFLKAVCPVIGSGGSLDTFLMRQEALEKKKPEPVHPGPAR